MGMVWVPSLLTERDGGESGSGGKRIAASQQWQCQVGQTGWRIQCDEVSGLHGEGGKVVKRCSASPGIGAVIISNPRLRTLAQVRIP